MAQQADELATSPALLGAGARRSASRPASSRPLIPARNAARVDPVQALQKGKYQVLSAGESRARVVLAAVLGVVSIVCLFVSGSRVRSSTPATSLAIVVALLLGPLLSLVAWHRPFGRR